MKTHTLLGKVRSWRSIAFALLIAVSSFAGSLSGLTNPTPTANAISDEQMQKCYDTFNGRDLNGLKGMTLVEQDLYNQVCKSFCKALDNGGDVTKPLIITCPNPTSLRQVQDAEVGPTVKLVCGDAPAGEAAQSAYLECAERTRSAYEDCDNFIVPIQGPVEDTDANTAACIYKRLPSPKPTAAQIQAKVAEGRKAAVNAANAAVTEQQQAEAKAKCEADGGTWTDNKCGTDKDEGDDKPTCNVDQIGWIVCPVTNFLSSLADTAYSVIGHFLTVQPLVTNDSNNGMYKAWTIMRNFSNVAFVIAFLIIIFSQVTSVGVTNYGIKKMLPKLIVAAVLVNVSYWLCAILVDISNIAGSSISDLFKNISSNLALPDKPDSSTGQGVAGLAGAAAAIFVSTGVLLYVGLSALIPLAIGAAITAITILLILVIRQVLIVLLIVVSPLAFVAFLLPNTESLFKKWRSLLTTLLVLFPLTGLVFGASGLAGTVIMNGASAGDEFTKVIYQTAGAAIPILGLALLVFLIKGLTSALGSIGGKMLGFINNPNKGPFDRMRKAGGALRDYRQNVNQTNRRRRARGEGRAGAFASNIGSEGSRTRRAAMWLAGSGVTASMNRDRKYSNAEAVNKSDEQSYVANRAATDTDYAQHITASTGSADLTKAYAIEAAEQEKRKDIAAAKTIFEHDRTSPDDLEQMIISGELDKTPAKKAAALQRFGELANSHGIQRMTNHLADLRNNNSNGDSEENIVEFQKTAAEMLEKHPLKPVNLSGSQLSAMKIGEFNDGEAARIKKTFQDGKTTAQHIGAKMDIDEMDRWGDTLADPANAHLLDSVPDENLQSTLKAVQDAEKDPRLNVHFGEREYKALDKLKTQIIQRQKARQDAAYQSYEDAGNIR